MPLCMLGEMVNSFLLYVVQYCKFHTPPQLSLFCSGVLGCLGISYAEA